MPRQLQKYNTLSFQKLELRSGAKKHGGLKPVLRSGVQTTLHAWTISSYWVVVARD